MVGCFIGDTLFSSDLMLTFVYEMMILIFEHTHNRHIKGECGEGGG